MTTDVPFHPLPIDQADVHYVPGPDSAPQEGVPAGVTTRFELESSIRFPGTSRTVWVHVPPGVDAGSPARVMVFNDGWWYLDPDGDVRGGVVLDNLIHRGAIPPMIGVFVDPGVLADGQKNRNREYDAFDARYADFLVDDVLAAVGERHLLSQRAADRGICGGSSGGNAAFTAAWMRPDQFGRVIAFNASFAQMPGGNPYPESLRTEPPRALRVPPTETWAGISGQAIGSQRTSARRLRSRKPDTTCASFSATAATVRITAACCCPMRSGGCGGRQTGQPRRLGEHPQRTSAGCHVRALVLREVDARARAGRPARGATGEPRRHQRRARTARRGRHRGVRVDAHQRRSVAQVIAALAERQPS